MKMTNSKIHRSSRKARVH